MKQDITHGVLWWEDHNRIVGIWKRKFRSLLMLVLVILMIGSLGFYESRKSIEVSNMKFVDTEKKLDNLESKYKILLLLRSKGISLNQGLEFADTVISQCTKLNLSIDLVMGLMKVESNFNPTAVSHKYALGIMQVHPVTWKEYSKKLGLDVGLNAAFDPITNIIISTHILKDLYEYYDGNQDKVLSAYRDGIKGSKRNGLAKKYIGKVAMNGEEFRNMEVK